VEQKLEELFDSYSKNVSGDFQLETKSFDSFLITSLDFVDTTAANVMIPYGQDSFYNRDFAENLLRTTSIILKMSDEIMTEEFEGIDREEQAKFFKVGAAREQPKHTIQEGINTMMESIALLMTQEIGRKDYEYELEKLKKIVDEDLIVDLVKKVPAGLIGPLILDGQYPEDILSEDGLRVESKDFRELKKEIQERYKSSKSINANSNPYYSFSDSESIFDGMYDRVSSTKLPGAVCPVGQQSERTDTNPLRSLGESFLHVMEELEKNY
jgi:hypothetical protein